MAFLERNMGEGLELPQPWARGAQLTPLARAAPSGCPTRLGLDVTHGAMICRGMGFGEHVIVLPCKMK